jgi:phosphate transport system protein
MKTRREESVSDILKSFEEMANLVLHQLTLLEKFMSLDSTSEGNNIISDIDANEKRIDEFEVVISDKIINSIVLYQPVASDIRKIISVYRMTINLERIGDRVINIIASIGSIMGTGEYKAMTDVILNMLISGASMVEKALLSFTNSDDSYAIWTIKNDEIIDEMNRKLLINAISKAKVSERTREMLLSYADLKNIITNIERIADHATNIAEATIYSLQGTDIRHKRIESSASSTEGT